MSGDTRTRASRTGVAHLERGGLEVRDGQPPPEHDVLTVDAWPGRLEASVGALATLVGEEVVRVWPRSLMGGGLAFSDGRMGVDQILAARPGATHTVPVVRAR